MKPVVIARRSILVQVISFAGLVAMLALLCQSFLSPELVVALALPLLALCLYRRNTIWIADGHLYYREFPLDFTVAVPLSSIEDVTLDKEHDRFVFPFYWAYVVAVKVQGGYHKIRLFGVTPALSVVLARLRRALGLPQTPIEMDVRPRVFYLAALFVVFPLLLSVMPLVSAVMDGELWDAAFILVIAVLGISGLISAFRDRSLLVLRLFWAALLGVAVWIYPSVGPENEQLGTNLYLAVFLYLITGLALTFAVKPFNPPQAPE